jgi:ABC-type lipoprotein release transport system permease subunit
MSTEIVSQPIPWDRRNMRYRNKRSSTGLIGHARIEHMDPNFLLLALVLVVLFASISIIGALHRIRNASEKALAILEAQVADKATRT